MKGPLPKDSNEPNELVAAENITPERAKQYQLNQVCGTATRQQKEALDKYFYCLVWGIPSQNLDVNYVKEHGIDSGAPALQTLKAMLLTGSCTAPPPLFQDPAEMTEPVVARAKILSELLSTMRAYCQCFR